MEQQNASGAVVSNVLAQKVARNAFWLVGGRFSGLALAGVVSILIARHLGAEGFGKFTLVYAHVALFGWIATFGMEHILIREASRNHDSRDSVFSIGYTVSVVFSVVAFVAAVGTSYLLGYEPDLRLLVAIGAAEMLLLQPFYVRKFVFRIELKQWVGVLAENGAHLLRLGAFAVLITLNASLLWFVSVKLLCGIAFAIAISVLAGRYVKTTWHPDAGSAVTLIRRAWPLGLAALGGIVLARMDQLMIHAVLDAKALGLYAASWSLVQFFGVFPNALMSSLFPIMSQRRASVSEVRRLARLGFKYSLIFIAPVAVGITIWADKIIEVLYGEQFSGGGFVLAILIWAMPSSFFGAVLRDTVIVAGRQNLIMTMTGVQIVAAIALNVTLIPLWGLAGAAVAAVIHPFIAVVVAPAFMSDTRRLTWIGLREAIVPAVACLGMAASALWMSFSLVAGLIAAAAVYGLLLAILRGIDAQDVKYLRAVLSVR